MAYRVVGDGRDLGFRTLREARTWADKSLMSEWNRDRVNLNYSIWRGLQFLERRYRDGDKVGVYRQRSGLPKGLRDLNPKHPPEVRNAIRVAVQTLKMPPAMRGVMGGPSKEEALDFLQYAAPEEIRKLIRQGYRLNPIPVQGGPYAGYGTAGFPDPAVRGLNPTGNPQARLSREFNFGDRVDTRMGVRRRGTVVKPFNWREATDGTYSSPFDYHAPFVWVAWDDGTKGWTFASNLSRAPYGGIGVMSPRNPRRGFAVTEEVYPGDFDPERDDPESGSRGRDLTLREALKEMEYGMVEPSDSRVGQARWFTAYGDPDYRTGETVQTSLHLPESVTPASRRRIARIMGVRGANPMDSANPDEAEIRRQLLELRSYFPYRTISGVLTPDGEFVTFANTTARQANDFARKTRGKIWRLQ